MKLSFVLFSLAVSPTTSNPFSPAPTVDPFAYSSGKATSYEGAAVGGACGFDGLPQISFPYGFAAAAGGDVFNDGYGCGACFEIICEGPSGYNPSCYCDGSTPAVVVQVNNLCPGCESSQLHLNTQAMERIAAPGLADTCGIIDTAYRRVDCDFHNTNIKIRSQIQVSPWWYGLHVDDVAGYGDIKSVMLTDSRGYTIACDKSDGPTYWVCRPEESITPVQVPMDVQLIDGGDRVLLGTGIITGFNGAETFDFGSNFPPIDSTAAPVLPTPSPTPNPTPVPTPAPPYTGPYTGSHSEPYTTADSGSHTVPDSRAISFS